MYWQKGPLRCEACQHLTYDDFQFIPIEDLSYSFYEAHLPSVPTFLKIGGIATVAGLAFYMQSNKGGPCLLDSFRLSKLGL